MNYLKIQNLLSKKEVKRLVANFTSLSFLQAANLLLPLLTLPYLVKVLGPEMFGLLMFIQAFILYMNMVVDFGFDLSATHEISVNRDDLGKLEEIVNSVFIIKLLLIVISFVVLMLVIPYVEKLSVQSNLVIMYFGIVIGQAMFPVWFFQGIENMKYITILNVVSKIIFTALIFIFIQSEQDFYYVPVFQSLGYIVIGIASLLIIRIKFKVHFYIPKYQYLRHYFLHSSQFFLSRVSYSVYTTSNVFILGLMTNNTLVGYYSIAEKLYGAMQSLYHPLVSALYPMISKTKNVKLFKSVFKVTVCAHIFVAALVYFYAEQIMTIVFSQDLGGSIQIFRLFLISSLATIPSILLGYPYLAALGHSKFANKSVGYASAIHFVGIFTLYFLSNITIYSVAIMVIVTEMSLFVIRCYYVNKFKLNFFRSSNKMELL